MMFIDTMTSWIFFLNKVTACRYACAVSMPQGEYTRSRLYDPGYDTKVLEVRDEVSGQKSIGKKLIGSAQCGI